MSFRYGYTVFPDGRNCRGGSPGVGCFTDGIASLGFSSAYLNALDSTAEKLFPTVNFQNYSTGGQNLNTAPIKWESPVTLNAALSKLAGHHTWKFGADYRSMKLNTTLLNNTAGSFTFQNLFTAGPNRVGGYDYASFLVGAPNAGSVDYNRGDGVYSLQYYGGYVQDDWRVSSRFTLNYGVRFEHESGLREKDDHITVGFDPSATSPELQAIEAAARRNGYTGPALKGGLIFAGVNGANDYQGDPPALKWSPRFGATWAIDGNTVLRGGYGLFYAPWQFTQQSHGTIGFTRTTTMLRNPAIAAPACPYCTCTSLIRVKTQTTSDGFNERLYVCAKCSRRSRGRLPKFPSRDKRSTNIEESSHKCEYEFGTKINSSDQGSD
jgi:hypothetical protein